MSSVLRLRQDLKNRQGPMSNGLDKQREAFENGNAITIYKGCPKKNDALGNVYILCYCELNFDLRKLVFCVQVDECHISINLKITLNDIVHHFCATDYVKLRKL